MKKISAIALAAVLAAATPVFAQNASTTLAPSQENPALPTENNADFGMFMQGFGEADFTSATEELDDATSFTVFKLSGMQNVDAAGFNEVLGTRENDLGALRGRITSNPEAVAALEAQGYTVDDVVAIQASGDNTVVFYVNDLEAM